MRTSANRSRVIAGDLQTSLNKRYGLEAGPIGGLGMMFNTVTAAFEHTSHYKVAWEKISTEGLTPEQVKRKRGQNAERLILLSKAMFVWCMSSAEYSMKEALELYPAVLNVPLKERYLGQLIVLMADENLIDTERRPLWHGANNLRNRLVHNNGVGNDDKVWQFAPNLTIRMEKGKMIAGTIMMFPLLTAWLVPAYAAWCEAFLDRAKRVAQSPN